MAVTSAEEFFAVLEKSNLLTPDQLTEAHRTAGPNDEPTTIAKLLTRQALITRWQAGQLLAGRCSFFLGRYRLIELLDRGGLGSVFLAEHVTMNRRVVLKVFARQVCEDRTALDRFLDEARAVASLDHPNIVHAYNIDNQSGRYYVVMEYVEGVDLQRLVERVGPLDADRAADYMSQAAEGLDYAHQRNMIHGSLKPSNLMINVQGVVKILDLGLTQLTAGGISSSGDRRAWVESPDDYRAPEQARRNAGSDHRVDVYSLGGTLYFLLVGHPPHTQGTRSEGTEQGQPPDLCAERPNVPAELADICRKMMATSPDDRYSTAAEVSQALAQWWASRPRLKRAKPLPKAKRLDEP